MAKTIHSILNLKDNFSPKLKKVADNTKKFNSQLRSADKLANGMIKSFSKVTKTVGIAGAAFAGLAAVSSINTFKDFEQSMANTSAIAGIKKTSEEYKRLVDAAREAGRTTTKTAAESADALGFMARAGWSVDESIKGLMPVLRLAEVAGGDLAATSDLVTDSMSAMGIAVDGLSGYLDALALADNKTNSSATQLMESYLGVGGTFKRLKTPMQESAALLGVLANRGIKGGEAGNSLSSTLINLTKKSGESAKAMKELGISAYDAATGEFKGITAVLEELNDKTKTLTAEQRDNYLTMIGGKANIATLDALMSGLNTTNAEGVSELKALHRELGNADGTLNEMAETINNTMAGAFKRLKSAIDDFKIMIGTKLEPYITPFINLLSERLPQAAEKFGEKLDEVIPKIEEQFKKLKDVLKEFGSVINWTKEYASEIISVLSGVAGGFASFVIITKVVKFFSKLKKAGGGIMGLFAMLKLKMLANPFVLAAAAVGLLVAGFVYAYQKSETFRNYVNELWEKLKGFGAWVKEWLLARLRELGAWFSEEIKPKIDVLVNAVMDLWEKVLKPFLDWLTPIFGAGVAAAFEYIKNKITNYMDIAKGVIGGFIDVLAGLIQFVTGVFTGDWKKAWDGVVNIFAGIGDALEAIIVGALNILIDKFNVVFDFLNRIPQKLSGIPGLEHTSKIEFGLLPRAKKSIPGFATGTQYFGGGLARINERGGEIVGLPGGSTVIPADKSERILNKKPDININVNIHGNLVGYNDVADKIGGLVCREVRLAMGNM